MKVAFWSPLPPSGSGIADYSEELLPYLAKGAELHLVVENDAPSSPALDALPWHLARDFDRVDAAEKFDVNLYQIGNNPHHRYVLNAALRMPGVVVLHDFVLQHLFLGVSVERGNVELYVSEMRRAYGERGAAIGRQIAAALGSELLTSKFPLSERLLERSHGVIVLSHFMERLIRGRLGSTAKLVGVVPHHYAPLPEVETVSREKARHVLELPQNAFLVAAFGLVTRAKRIARAICGFKRFAAQRPDARFLIVGDVDPGLRLDDLLGLLESGRVELLGRQPLSRFYLHLAAADVVVNLRFPSTGEVSGALIRALGMGKPVLVSNGGPFVELPEWAAARIDVGAYEVEEIAAVLELFAARPDLRERMGRWAREHVRRFHTLEGEARQYLAFLETVIEARRRGAFTAPLAWGDSDLAAAVLASISDIPLGATFGLETVREALRSATERDPEGSPNKP